VALRIATTLPGASINDVTDPLDVDPVSGNAAFNGVAVEVRPVVQAAPAVEARA
jgi:hypothetical protein